MIRYIRITLIGVTHANHSDVAVRHTKGRGDQTDSEAQWRGGNVDIGRNRPAQSMNLTLHAVHSASHTCMMFPMRCGEWIVLTVLSVDADGVGCSEVQCGCSAGRFSVEAKLVSQQAKVGEKKRHEGEEHRNRNRVQTDYFD